MDMARRHPLLAALSLGALAATGFAPLGLWPITLLCVAGLMWLMDLQHQPSGHAALPAATSLANGSASLAPLPQAGGVGGGPRHAFLLGWAFGVGHFTVGNNWIAHAFVYQDAMPHWLGYFAVAALSLYLAIYPGLATLGLHLARTRWPGLAATPFFAALWIVTEYGRATIFTGFAWDPLGMIWLDTGVDQSARIIGTYGLSGLAIIAGGALLALFRRRWHVGAPLLATLGALAILGHIDMGGDAAKSGIPITPITVVQPNINQNEKYDPALEEENFTKLAQLTGPSSPDKPRLIFWPEAALPAWLDMEPEWLERVAALLGPNDLLMTGGAKVYFRERGKGFYKDRTLVGANNSAWVVTPDARLIARYDKAHLVPYGEYLPMRSLLEPLGLSRLVPGDADFWPGPGPRSLLLPAAGAEAGCEKVGTGFSQQIPRPQNGGACPPSRPAIKMGAQICYEIIFSGQVVHRANRPAFLYNPSNDAWFGSWGPPQHLAQARMRAIEEAMPVIRSTPTGISAVIDARGALVASIPHHQAGSIDAFLPTASPPTLFSRFGNMLPLAFAAGLGALTLLLLARRGSNR